MVVSNSESSAGSNQGGTLNIRHLPLRMLEAFDKQAYQGVVDAYSTLADNLITRLNDKGWASAGQYIQNVIVFNSPGERDCLYEYLLAAGRTFPRRFFGFVFDATHCHVIHSCAFSSGQCKCKWKKDLPCGDLLPGYGDRGAFSKWTVNDFIYNVAYFFYKKQGRKEIYFGGRAESIEDSRKY